MMPLLQHSALSQNCRTMNASLQYVSLIGGSVDGELAGIAGYISIGSMLQEQFDTVQVSRSSSIIQDCVSIAGLGIHIPT